MVGMLASSVEDRGFEPRSDQTKETIKLLATASMLSTHLSGVRTKTGWLKIRIMCPSGTICLST
jgi:hypothetical protein